MYRKFLARFLSVALATTMTMTSMPPVNASSLEDDTKANIDASDESTNDSVDDQTVTIDGTQYTMEVSVEDENGNTISYEDYLNNDYDLSFDLLKLDVTNDTVERINEVINSNTVSQVAAWISSLSEEDIQILMSRNTILNEAYTSTDTYCEECGLLANMSYNTYFEYLNLVKDCEHQNTATTFTSSTGYINVETTQGVNGDRIAQEKINISGVNTKKDSDTQQSAIAFSIQNLSGGKIKAATQADYKNSGQISSDKTAAATNYTFQRDTGSTYIWSIIYLNVTKPLGYAVSDVNYVNQGGYHPGTYRSEQGVLHIPSATVDNGYNNNGPTFINKTSVIVPIVFKLNGSGLANHDRFKINFVPAKYNITYHTNGTVTNGGKDYTETVTGGSNHTALNVTNTNLNWKREFTVNYNVGNGGTMSNTSSTLSATLKQWGFYTAASNGAAINAFNAGEVTDGASKSVFAKINNNGTAHAFPVWNDATGTLLTPTAKNYRLNYNAGKGTVAKSYDEKATTFNGWYSGSTNKGKGGATLTNNGNITLTANWTNPAVTLPSAVGPTYTVSYQDTELTTIPSTNVTSSFGGWNIGGKTYAANSSYTMTTDSTQATAVWKDAEITLPEAPVSASQNFKGWTVNGATGKAPGTKVTISNNTVITAEWTHDATYNIKYIGNGGSTLNNETEYTQIGVNCESDSLSSNQFIRPGYTFVGWGTVASATSPTYEDEHVVSGLATKDQTTTLYAIWKENKYTVRFGLNSDESVVSATNPSIINGIDKMILPQAIKDDKIEINDKGEQIVTPYIFLGWTDIEGDSTVKYPAAYEFNTLTSDGTYQDEVILYPVWTNKVNLLNQISSLINNLNVKDKSDLDTIVQYIKIATGVTDNHMRDMVEMIYDNSDLSDDVKSTLLQQLLNGYLSDDSKNTVSGMFSQIEDEALQNILMNILARIPNEQSKNTTYTLEDINRILSSIGSLNDLSKYQYDQIMNYLKENCKDIDLSKLDQILDLINNSSVLSDEDKVDLIDKLINGKFDECINKIIEAILNDPNIPENQKYDKIYELFGYQVSDDLQKIINFLNAEDKSDKYDYIISLIQGKELSDAEKNDLVNDVINSTEYPDQKKADLIQSILGSDVIDDIKKDLINAIALARDIDDPATAIHDVINASDIDNAKKELIKAILDSKLDDQNTLIKDVLDANKIDDSLVTAIKGIIDDYNKNQAQNLINGIIPNIDNANDLIDLINRILNSELPVSDKANAINTITSADINDTAKALISDYLNSRLPIKDIVDLVSDAIQNQDTLANIDKVRTLIDYILGSNLDDATKVDTIKQIARKSLDDDNSNAVYVPIKDDTNVSNADKTDIIDLLKKLSSEKAKVNEKENPSVVIPTIDTSTLEQKLDEIKKVSDLNAKELAALKALISNNTPLNDDVVGQIINAINNSTVNEAEKLRILRDLANGCLTEADRKLLEDAINQSGIKNKQEIIDALGKVSNLTLAEQKKILEALNKGSSIEYAAGDGTKYIISKNTDGTLTIKLKDAKGTTIVIPGQVVLAGKAYAITEIADNAFKNNTKIVNVTCPSQIVRIGKSAFEGCTNMTTFKTNEGLIIIDQKAFKGCTKLGSFYYPNTLQTINTSAFENCKALKNVTFRNGLLMVRSKAFKGCTSLKTVALSKNIQTIGSSAFANCKSLKKVTFKDFSSQKLKSLGQAAFANDTALTSIKIPSKITTIQKKTFYNCTKLRKVSGMNRVVVIAKSAFENCKSMKSITLKSRVQKISVKAFYNCKNLKTVNIKSKALTSVGSKAFKKCKKNITFKCPNSKIKSYSKKLKGKY